MFSVGTATSTDGVFSSQQKYDSVGASYTTNGEGNLEIITTEPVVSIIAESIVYSPSQANGIGENNTFECDIFTNQLTLFPISPLLVENGNVILKVEPQLSFENNLYRDVFPSFLEAYNYTGKIKLTRRFREHPSGELTIVINQENITSIREQLKPGTEININEVGLIVSSLRPTLKSPSKYADKIIEIVLPLAGKWSPQNSTFRSPLDELLKVENANFISLTDMFDRINIPYVGADIDHYLPTEQTNIINPRDVFEDNAISLKGFPFYSNTNQIELRDWQQDIAGTIYTFKNDLVDIEENGFGARIGDVNLIEEFRNTKYTFDTFDNTNTGQVVTIEYENTFSDDDLLVPFLDIEGFQINFDGFKSAANQWNNSGETKKRRLIVTENGITTFIEEVVYGFAYTTKDPYTDLGGTVQNEIQYNDKFDLFPVWKQVQHTYTERFFNSDGYNTGQREFGFRFTPFQPESNLETYEIILELQELAGGDIGPVIGPNGSLKLTGAQRTLLANLGVSTEDIDRLAGQLTLAEYEEFPFNRITNNVLANLSNVYNDVTSDDSGVFPHFIQQQLTIEEESASRPDPESTVDDPKPDLYLGFQFEERILNTIKIPNEEVLQPETYTETRIVRSSEGRNRRNNASQSTSTDRTGRPPEAERKVTYPENTLNTPVVNFVPGRKYFLVSEGADIDPVDDIERGTVSYPNIFDINQIVDIASVDLSIRNVDTQRVTLNFSQPLGFQEGQVVSFNCNTWVILEIIEQYTIQNVIIANGPDPQQNLIVDQYQLTLGRYLFPEVTLKELS